MTALKLPAKGVMREELLSTMRDFRADDSDWKNARTWSLVYYAGEELTELLKEAYGMFFCENALNPMAFPSLRKFETEVIAMTADLLGGGPEAAGNMTSGGTESIILGVLAARERARAERPRITAPEMVLPITAHASFYKAAHFLGVKPVKIPIGPDYRADVEAARSAVNDNTVLMVGSAPCYPYGVVDPIPDLAAIARERGINFHVDACLGGFMLPFLKRLGHKIPEFDLGVPGVTSISADLHKYGYSAKGASTIIFRDASFRRHQYFIHTDWPGGVYASPTMTGTRPGGAIAAAWAALKHIGEEGYLRLASTTIDTTKKLIDGINSIPGLRVMGRPDMSTFAFDSEEINMYTLGDALEGCGWHLDRLQLPPALHLIVMQSHSEIVRPFLDDLAAATAKLIKQGKTEATGMAALYGMIGTMPDRGAAHEIVLGVLDDLFKHKPK
jgi:sphinganine-1-phosphate aldolase